MLSKVYTCVNNCWMFAGYIQTEIRGASLIFVLKERVIFVAKERERELGSVRHDLELCALWWLTCQKPSYGREYWIFICKTGSSSPFPTMQGISRLMGDSVQYRVTSSSEVHDEWIFSVYFLRSLLDGLMHEFVILTERWIYLSLCLLLQWKWPLNVQCNSCISSTPRICVVERGWPSAFALRPMNIC